MPTLNNLQIIFSDSHNLMDSFLRKWMIGVVGKLYGTLQNPMLVLNGDQQIGKSFFVHWLCPLSDYFIESPINPEDKDNDIRLISKWIWEVGELGATTRRADLSILKFFLTKEQVTVRKPWGRRDLVKPALASFIGTINPDGGGFLHDNTGERRFRPLTITGIDWEYVKLDVNQLWAEAYHAYKQGETNEITREEKLRLDEINEEEYKAPDPITQMILAHFTLTENFIDDRISNAEVLSILENNGLRCGSSRANAMAVAMAMKTLKRGKARNNNQRFYCGLRIQEAWNQRT